VKNARKGRGGEIREKRVDYIYLNVEGEEASFEGKRERGARAKIANPVKKRGKKKDSRYYEMGGGTKKFLLRGTAKNP